MRRRDKTVAGGDELKVGSKPAGQHFGAEKELTKEC
jgi:hypothetical protein